jgi:acetyl esterase/lipase
MLNVPFPTASGGNERLDVYLPAYGPSVGGRPVLIAIHGGGWRRLDKAGYGARIASAFVPRGYVVVAPDYRLSAPGRPSWPVNFEDVQAAVSWVRVNSGMLGINPDRIAVIGESAGANLAALLGTTARSFGGAGASVQAVIAFSTPTDLTALAAESPLAAHAAAQFLGGTPEQMPANYTAASPIDHVSAGDPPMFFVQGRQDPLIPASQSVQMVKALESVGVSARLAFVNGGHDLDFPAHYSNLIHQILEFLDATWKDE